MTSSESANACGPPVGRSQPLSRSLSLTHAVLFGLGVTIGAGIYVLIGATAGRAGLAAPFAFLIAALVMAPTAATFAEFAGRHPVSAGEAAYVGAGFGSEPLARFVGLLVVAVAIVSAAAIARGSAGYIRELTGLPVAAIVPMVVVAMGIVAGWGIVESVAFAGLMTLIEVGGLLAIVAVGTLTTPDLLARLPEAMPQGSGLGAWSGVLAASLLAFFAFIGFEGLANIAEEVKEPERTLPQAIFLTLAVSTLLYIAVVWIALIAVPEAELARSDAPLSLVFERVTGASPVLISAIAVVATINGVVVQMVMGSRVLYGLASRGLLPAALARVSATTRTPLVATAAVVAAVLLFAVALPLEPLAEATSRLTLVIFALVNAALLRLKIAGVAPPAGAFRVPMLVPAAGTLLCAGLLAADLLR